VNVPAIADGLPAVLTGNELGVKFNAGQILVGPPGVMCQAYNDTAASFEVGTPFGTTLAVFDTDVLIQSIRCTV
jgi:hypothetical protein